VIDTEYYSLTATLPPGATRSQMAGMLAGLLSDRFGFIFHHDARDERAYSLVVSPGGARLTRSLGGGGAETSAGAKPLGSGASVEDNVDSNGFPILRQEYTFRVEMMAIC